MWPSTPPFSFFTLISIEQKFFSRRNGHFGTHPNNKRGAACAGGDGAQRFCAAFCLFFLFLASVRGRELRLGSPPSSGRFLDLSNCAKALGKSFSTFFAGCVFLIFWFIFYDSTHFFYELDGMFACLARARHPSGVSHRHERSRYSLLLGPIRA